ncbi:thioredoxin family protein [Sideroxydans sp. CL21]|uniref:thioredoxin family protein n=1 Tax=Sideroxydans sp. CL21 TaxID=2600596 RepID=UPI0012A92E74|nr:thioredoxin family protein [Sideroxydans sp. CL21]VVC84697.1 hypothetical protein [Sideroxydans sp. CL21]
MSSCANSPDDAPVIKLTLAGTGEPLLRMEKRLSCAAGGAGIRLMLEVRKDIDALDIPDVETPLVLYEGKMIFSGLPRTEEIEARLKQLV